jgi:hypothetical protein
MQVWHDDGVPANIPMFITESNISSQASEASVDIFGALWLADYAGAFLTGGGDALYYFHYIPFGVGPGCNNSGGTFGMFAVDNKNQVTQPLAQFFASQLINLEWLKAGAEVHQLYSAASDVQDNASHTLVTVYAVKRPDEQWALLVINKDQENPHVVRVKFHNAETDGDTSFTGPVDLLTFGRAQYKWDPLGKVADPDGPTLKSKVDATTNTAFELPAASVTVLRGKIK